MMNIKTIEKILKLCEVDKYKIIENNIEDYQRYYVIQNLETTRKVNVKEITVTVYKEIAEDNDKYLGEASFLISKDMTKEELAKEINDAQYAASLVKNEYYELVKGSKKKSVSDFKVDEPYKLIDNIANIYFDNSTKEVKFNSLEIFVSKNNVHLVNSCGVNHIKEYFTISIEAIPSYNANGIKTELYRMYNYTTIDLNKITEDAKSAVKDVYSRAEATKLDIPKEVDIILRGEEIKELMWELIYLYSYDSIYNKINPLKLGDMISKNKFTLTLSPRNKADISDDDGVLLRKHRIIDKGKLVNYYGNNRYAYYLGVQPSGNLNKVIINSGKVKSEILKSKPHIEIIDLSGIQLDAFASYLGGEVRLANYYDGKTMRTISAFSFSMNLQDAIDSMVLSSDCVSIKGYDGPKCVLLRKGQINS